MSYGENNNTDKSAQKLSFEERFDYLKDLLLKYRTQLQTLDHRIAYILGGNGVILGVELYFALSPVQCANAVYIPLLVSLSLIAVSSIIAVIGNLPGNFLIRLGEITKILPKREKDFNTMRTDGTESLKTMDRETLLKRMFEEGVIFERVVKVKLCLLMWASCFLVANFLTILVLIFMRYSCLPS